MSKAFTLEKELRLLEAADLPEDSEMVGPVEGVKNFSFLNMLKRRTYND